MTSSTSRSVRRVALLALATGLLAVTAACSDLDNLLGINQGSKAVLLKIQSISLRSDHPANAAAPTGPAVIGSNDIIRFQAIGTFLIVGTMNLQTNDVSGGVIWTSSAPTVAIPGADGRVAAHGTSGTALITATSPAIGDIPALSSNSISLTIQ